MTKNMVAVVKYGVTVYAETMEIATAVMVAWKGDRVGICEYGCLVGETILVFNAVAFGKVVKIVEEKVY